MSDPRVVEVASAVTSSEPSPAPPTDPRRHRRGRISHRRGRISQDPEIVVPAEVLARHNARILEPVTAPRRDDQSTVRSTVYVVDSLIVRGLSHADALPQSLLDAASSAGVSISESPKRRERRLALTELAARHKVRDADRLFPAYFEITPQPGGATPVDAWAVVQNYAARADRDRGVTLSLDHLLTANRHIHGSPFEAPTASYGRPGYGARLPVRWNAAVPARDESLSAARDRPVVAVLDTGCGEHVWFTEGVTRNCLLDGTLIGLEEPGDSETTGVSDPLEGELDADSGHGTFIAGLVRQECPDADLLSVRVMSSDGAVPEHVLIDALGLLVARQSRQDPHETIDVLSLSLGYYHEQAEDEQVDQPLEAALDELAALGVAVVVAAGNDATSRPMYPAAFAAQDGADPGDGRPRVPVVSVGARNPSGTVALFSNAGDWVTTRRYGVNLVSTFPPTLNGAEQAGVATGDRATLDPDNFSSGFGIWSGTSFAAPLFAGELARALLSGTYGTLSDLDPGDAVIRTTAAVTACLETVEQ